MKKLLIISAAFILISNMAFAADHDSASMLSDMSARITSLEEENRHLNGRIDELEYQLNNLTSEPPILPAQSLPAEDMDEGADYTLGDRSISKSDAMGERSGYYVTRPGEVNSEYTVKVPFETAPKGDEAEFNSAFAHLGKEEYPQAEKAFSDIIKNNPESAYVGQSHFWLGEIAASKDDYNMAAIEYLKSYKIDPKGVRAAESTMKLAAALKKLGKNAEACKNYKRFETEFPKAHENLRDEAREGVKTLGCK